MTREEAIEHLKLIRLNAGMTGSRSFKEALDLAIVALSQPSLPDNLDEAADKFAQKEYPDEPSIGQFGTGDYEPHVDMEYPREISKDSFKAGAEWMAGQGYTFETTMQNDDVDELVPTCPDMYNHGYSCGDKVIVQIRNKQ